MTLHAHHWYAVAQDCPLPTTHRRLEQAHRLWHQALDAYQDLDAFLTNLNAAIQALRSVTFMLQSEKAAIPEFNDWYVPQQADLRKDPILKWLSDARTEVVHRSDLELASSAHAVIHNNRTHFSVKKQLDPTIPTELLALALIRTLPEPFSSNKGDLVLGVEREWRVPNLEATELLHALAHGYGVLRMLVADAHENAGRQCPSEPEPPGSDGIPPCMRSTRGARTIRVSLGSGELLRARTGRIMPTPEETHEGTIRYGAFPRWTSGNPEDLAELLLRQAKRVLVTDGYHIRIFYLITPSGIHLIQGEAFDRPTKYALMQQMAEEVTRHSATAIIEIAEAWMAPLDQMGPDMNAATAQGRVEVLVVTLAAADGTLVQHTTPFRRGDDGAVLLDETFTSCERWPDYLVAVAEAWGLAR